MRRSRAWFALIGLAVLVGIGVWTLPRLPEPTGDAAVGRERMAWIDTRPETATTDVTDAREVVIEAWHPARVGTGSRAAYVPELERITAGLLESGELGPVAVLGLNLVAANAAKGAEVVDGVSRLPVVVFSPGNATNVEFYASLAEDLASRGFIVLGINHPYDVAAVALTDGHVAVYRQVELMTPSARTDHLAKRIDERVADVLNVVDRVRRSDGVFGRLSARIDPGRISVVGHSLGGITAARACASDSRLRSCANIDGLQGGGPFSVWPGEARPQQPFLFISKERDAERYAGPTIETLTISDATHRDFTDGPLIEPSLTGRDRSLAVMRTVRDSVAGFLDRTLR